MVFKVPLVRVLGSHRALQRHIHIEQIQEDLLRLSLARAQWAWPLRGQLGILLKSTVGRSVYNLGDNDDY